VLGGTGVGNAGDVDRCQVNKGVCDKERQAGWPANEQASVIKQRFRLYRSPYQCIWYSLFGSIAGLASNRRRGRQTGDVRRPLVCRWSACSGPWNSNWSTRPSSRRSCDIAWRWRRKSPNKCNSRRWPLSVLVAHTFLGQCWLKVTASGIRNGNGDSGRRWIRSRIRDNSVCGSRWPKLT